MALGTTTRLGLTTWSSGDDAFGRAQLQADHLALDSLAAILRQGLAADRPVATDPNVERSLYYSTDTGVLEYSDGTQWIALNTKAQSADASTIVAGSVSTPEGSSTRLARADHKHAISTATAVSVNGSNAEGSSTSLARADHTHAIDDTLRGQSSDASTVVAGSVSTPQGTATRLARADHKHSISTASASSISGSNSEGSSTSLARADHNHALDGTLLGQSGDAYTVVAGTVSSPQGSASRIARSDHKHSISTAAASTISGTNSEGSATSLARSDHNHALGTGVVDTTQLAATSVTKAKLNTDIVSASGGITFTTLAGLSLSVDSSTVEINTNTLRVKDGGITAAKLNSNTAGIGLTQNGTSKALDVNYDTTTLTISGGKLAVNGGITTTSAGAPSSSPSAGYTNVDTSNGIFSYRTSSAWVNTILAAGTAGTGAPSARGIWVSNAVAPTSGDGAVGDIWIMY